MQVRIGKSQSWKMDPIRKNWSHQRFRDFQLWTRILIRLRSSRKPQGSSLTSSVRRYRRKKDSRKRNCKKCGKIVTKQVLKHRKKMLEKIMRQLNLRRVQQLPHQYWANPNLLSRIVLYVPKPPLITLLSVSLSSFRTHQESKITSQSLQSWLTLALLLK